MAFLGKLTTLTLVVGLAAAISLGWRSRGDVERYLKMRNM
jgi:hypothetical protein